MKKETATEWLFKQLWEEPKDKFTWNAILDKAKEMEDEIILDCVIEACNKPHIAMSYYWKKLYGKKY